MGQSGNSVDAARIFSYFADMYAEEEKECQVFSREIRTNILPLLAAKKLPPKAVEDIQNIQQEFFPFAEDSFTQSCQIFLQKMIREINIGYLEQEKERYSSLYQTEPESLEDLEKISSFLPTDFQQYTTRGIYYNRDAERKKIVYSMKNHQ